MRDRSCLSIWFPRLETAGLPVPKTLIVRWPGDKYIEMVKLLDGQEPEGWPEFLVKLSEAACEVGFPAFLRTGQGSGKHNWNKCCYVPNVESIASHVAELVNWSHLVDFLGLPHDVWAVREFLPTKPVAILPRYGDMPLVPEIRAFVRDGRVLCAHPYWPKDSVLEGFARKVVSGDDLIDGSKDFYWPEDLAEADRLYELLMKGAFSDVTEPMILATRVATAFDGDGAWSVDLLPTEKGWFVTDMAVMENSFHWEDCPNNPRRGD